MTRAPLNAALSFPCEIAFHIRRIFAGGSSGGGDRSVAGSDAGLRAGGLPAACARVSAAQRFGFGRRVCGSGWAAVFTSVDLRSVGAMRGHVSSQERGSRRNWAVAALDLRWSLAIGALWIAASIARAVDLGVHSLRSAELWKTARCRWIRFNQQCRVPRVPRRPCGRQGKRRPPTWVGAARLRFARRLSWTGPA